jgi:hypothetical protein
MMTANGHNTHGHHHLSRAEHHYGPSKLAHMLNHHDRMGGGMTATNYMESSGAIAAQNSAGDFIIGSSSSNNNNNAMAATMHQQQRRTASPSAVPICLHPYGAATNPQGTTSSPQSIARANVNHWPPATTTNHKLYTSQDQNCGQLPLATANTGAYYGYLPATTFAASYGDSAPRLSTENKLNDSGRRLYSDNFNEHQNQFQHTNHHHHQPGQQQQQQQQQHHHHQQQQQQYVPATVSQNYANYNVDQYSSSQRIYQHEATTTTTTTSSNHHQNRYSQQAAIYHDQHALSFNQTAPIGEPSSSSSSASTVASSAPSPPPALYHHYHQSYIHPSAKTTAVVNRFTFIETVESRSRQQAESQTAGFWASHQYQEHGPRASAAQQLDTNGIVQPRISGWPDSKPVGEHHRALHNAHYQCPESGGYEYCRQECPPEQLAYIGNDTGQQVHQQAQSSPPVALNSADRRRHPDGPVIGDAPEAPEKGPNTPARKEPKTESGELAETPALIVQASNKTTLGIGRTEPSRGSEEGGSSKFATIGVSSENNQAAPTAANSQPDRLNQCGICGRHYARPSTLKTHLRTHTNERPYKCAVCCKTFSQAANLTAHQRVHTGK